MTASTTWRRLEAPCTPRSFPPTAPHWASDSSVSHWYWVTALIDAYAFGPAATLGAAIAKRVERKAGRR